ncbi:hypothetical protein T07_1586 [Trichinella nelsoni]|uniref:Uncharacterized protein n=1 Tax=Trichinella nelsoni TaxID=6336 RepID=A0A0V0SGG5_9BILA|nr:hypothetical protein T07_1586 [Trichinella nelsoni]
MLDKDKCFIPAKINFLASMQFKKNFTLIFKCRDLLKDAITIAYASSMLVGWEFLHKKMLFFLSKQVKQNIKLYPINQIIVLLQMYMQYSIQFSPNISAIPQIILYYTGFYSVHNKNAVFTKDINLINTSVLKDHFKYRFTLKVLC